MWCKKQKQAKEEFTVVYYNNCTVHFLNYVQNYKPDQVIAHLSVSSS